jgi:uncharacterized protein
MVSRLSVLLRRVHTARGLLAIGGCVTGKRRTRPGRAFLDQDLAKARRVIHTNVTGTVYLIHKVGNDMRRRNCGRILITGPIAGFMPGRFQAVYNGTKAFLNSFSFALLEELRNTKVTVTCLMPGATETEFCKHDG